MSKLTPEQEGRYALDFGVGRDGLSAAAQLAYDRVNADRESQQRRWAVREQLANEAGRSPFELPSVVDGPCWSSDCLAISREWVAFREFAGRVPWGVIPYDAVASVRRADERGIAISGPDGDVVVVGQTALVSLEACLALAEGLGTNEAVASAGDELLRPHLEAARAERELSLASRHVVDRSGTTHTFRFHRRRHILLGISALAFAGFFLAGAIAFPASGWNPRDGDKGLEAQEIVTVLALAYLATRQFRAGVQVSAEKLISRGGFITRTVWISEITAIAWDAGDNLRTRPSWVPRVDLASGKRFWITEFDCGPGDRPPDPELAASLDEFRMLLGVEHPIRPVS